MKELPKQFTGKGQVKGWEFVQLAASPAGYVYSVFVDGKPNHYEVFRHKVNTRFDSVTYPSEKAFGIYAWTFKRVTEAMEKWRNL